MRRLSSLSTTLLVFALLAALTVLPAATATADAPCPLPANQPTKKSKQKKVKKSKQASKGGKKAQKKKKGSAAKSKPIILKPESSSEVINFGGTRGMKSIDVVLLASRPLPPTFSPKQLELDSPKRFRRSSPTLNSAALPLPRFSHPQLIEHRRKIRVRICIDSSDAQAGAYTGTVYISGPPGITSANVTVTANVKTSGCLFLFFLILALIAAFLLLWFKAAKETREKDEAEKKANPAKQVTGWGSALVSRLTDPTFVVSTIVALGAAFVAMRAIYDGTPAWGADTWTNAFALCGTAFGAAGVGSLITTFTPSGD